MDNVHIKPLTYENFRHMVILSDSMRLILKNINVLAKLQSNFILI
jgi:hypothetical protein